MSAEISPTATSSNKTTQSLLIYQILFDLFGDDYNKSAVKQPGEEYSPRVNFRFCYCNSYHLFPSLLSPIALSFYFYFLDFQFKAIVFFSSFGLFSPPFLFFPFRFPFDFFAIFSSFHFLKFSLFFATVSFFSLSTICFSANGLAFFFALSVSSCLKAHSSESFLLFRPLEILLLSRRAFSSSGLSAFLLHSRSPLHFLLFG